ncbi:hypothetical protein SOVF_118460 isoform A, partial [Spinacia oleracea]
MLNNVIGLANLDPRSYRTWQANNKGSRKSLRWKEIIMKSCVKVDTLACVEHNHSCVIASNDPCVLKCDFEIDRKVKKDMHESSFVQGDPYDDVITIPDTFGMDLDDVKSLTLASNGKRCMSKKSMQGNPMPKRTWFGPHSISGGLGKLFVPKEAKKGLLTSVDS